MRVRGKTHESEIRYNSWLEEWINKTSSTSGADKIRHYPYEIDSSGILRYMYFSQATYLHVLCVPYLIHLEHKFH